MPRIIREQHPTQRGLSLRQHRQKETAVRDTLRTRYPDRKRVGCFYYFIIYSRNAVNFICHGSVYPSLLLLNI